jgi:hypothetical protein
LAPYEENPGHENEFFTLTQKMPDAISFGLVASGFPPPRYGSEEMKTPYEENLDN